MKALAGFAVTTAWRVLGLRMEERPPAMGVAVIYIELELERVFDKFPTYHIKILLGDFNAKVGREDTFKPTIGNESLHKISNDNGVKLVNFATSKNLRVKSMMFAHRNIHKYTWTSPDGKTHDQIDHILVDTRRYSNFTFDHTGQQIVIVTAIWWWQTLEGD
jgi:hypothetical protein